MAESSGVAVAIADRDDPCGELLELRAQASRARRSRTTQPSLQTRTAGGNGGRPGAGARLTMTATVLTRLDLRGAADVGLALCPALRPRGGGAGRRRAGHPGRCPRKGDGRVAPSPQRFDGGRPRRPPGARRRLEARAARDPVPSARPRSSSPPRTSREYHAPRPTWPARARPRRRVACRVVASRSARAGLLRARRSAVYPSTVLMTAIPARVAGVDDRAVRPPGGHGRCPTPRSPRPRSPGSTRCTASAAPRRSPRWRTAPSPCGRST